MNTEETKVRRTIEQPWLRVALVVISAAALQCGANGHHDATLDAAANQGTGGSAGAGSAGTGGSAASGGRGGGAGTPATAGASGRAAGAAGTKGNTAGQGGRAGVSGAAGHAGAAQAGASAGSGDAGGGAGSPAGWKLAWSDEFDGPSGSSVDSANWNLVNKGDGFGNNELEYYTPRPENAALDGNGMLVITARKESYQGKNYTSARLESNGKFEHTYGRIEARIKIPRGQGIWPAFWMLGNDIGSAGWPKCGEVDIMENIGKEPSTVHGSLHGPGYSGGNPLGKAYMLPSGQAFADAFHVFAVEWEENVIRFYVDADLYETRTPADVPSGSRWVYDHPFYLLLNVAVGGQWPGSPDGTTVFPQTMTVDYVRVYERQ
jgi:beta-glucanase (GH16 family)